MKKIYSTLGLLLFFFAVLQAQPTLYGLTNSQTDFISKYDVSTNTLIAATTLQVNAKNPASDLIKASNGKLYGMTTNGGSSDVGVIFSYDAATGTYANLKDFDGDDGANPYGSLVQASNGKLYGMTRNGGSNGIGVIFSFDPVTGVYTNLKDFDDTNGRRPQGSLVQAGNGKLYGMTFSGGSTGDGVIFSFDPASGIYAKLKDFAGTDGANPFGSLIQANNGTLYGMTYSGGSSSYGVVFSFNPATAAYAVLKEFDGVDGGNPQGSLVQASNGALYGVTSIGGRTGDGVIFSFNLGTTAYTVLKEFTGTDGRFPQGSLVQTNGALYGTTYSGGGGGVGVIFSFDPATTDYTILKELDGTDGSSPKGSLVQASNGKFFGVTPNGGSSNIGVIFSLDITTIPTYTQVKDFASIDGRSPYGSLVQAKNGKLYGMTYSGGSYGNGVIFSFDPATADYLILKDFDGTYGKNPQGSLVQATNGKLYGMTQYGGSSGNGVIFSFDPATSVYTKLKDFAGTDGSNPYGSLIQASNGKLYGMTFTGGSNNAGVIFSFDPATAAYTKVKDFGGTEGANPYGDLMQASNGKLYGMTLGGGSSYGVIFSFDPATATYTKVKDFDFTNGKSPYGSLMQASNGILYGMTSGGGGSDYGVVFSFDLSGTYTKIHDFDYANGGRPFGTLMQAGNGTLHGMTRTGGSSSAGVVFSVDPSSGTYTKLNDFDGTNGAEPYGALIEVASGTDAAAISTGSLNSSYCPGSSVTVNYTATGIYNSGNVFTAQLSDASGSFTSPDNIGTVTATASGTINATIPTSTADGTGYRIRVVSTNPAVTGTDNGNNIAITALVTFYQDIDGDGYGDNSKPFQACSAPQGYVANNTDCDDSKASVHPGATEVCNGIDDNCDGQIDEGMKTIFYADADGDGYGNSSKSTQACSAPAGYVSDNTDCDDTKASVHPNAAEVCNGIDDDCDGQIDEGIATVTYYRDADGDGYGNAAISTTSCSRPSGYVSNSTDCDDSKASVHPGAAEICGDGLDNNCNGQIDENCGGLPKISINDVTVYESEGAVVVTISLDKVSASAISINYTTQSGTAIGSGKGAKTFDFTSASGSVRIAAGIKTAPIRIAITKDAIAEIAESFKVNLSLKGKNSKNATIVKSTGTVTINDGIKPTLTIIQSVTKTAMKEVQPLAIDVRAYPNPTTSSFTINVSSTNKKEAILMLVTDVNGRVIEKRANLAAGQTLQIGGQYWPGSYFVEVIQGKARTHLKLVKIVY